MFRRSVLALLLVTAVTGCRLKDDSIPAPPDVAAPPADALRTASGLTTKVISIGFSNVKPGPTSSVTVSYTGWTPDGRMFDSSVAKGGKPVPLDVNGVIAGWTEGLQLMVVGEKRRFWIPGKLAYHGNPAPGQPAWTGNPSTPPKGPLVFDVVLESVR